MDYTTTSDQGLETLYSNYSSRLIELQIEGDKATAIDVVVKEMTKIETERLRRGSTGQRSTSTDSDTQIGKDMRSALERVTVLAPGVNSTDFLASLENTYKNYVEERPGLETRFCKIAITRMCDSFQTQIHGLEEKINTWVELKTFVSENYAVRLTPYQKMDHLFDLEVKNSDWTSYCVELQNSADEVLRFVEAKFQKKHPNEELTSKRLFDIIAVQIFLRKLQEGSDRSAYDYICGQLHDAWNINSALALAKNFIDRRNKSDSVDPVSENATFFGRNSQRPGQGRRNKGRKSGEAPKPTQTETAKTVDSAKSPRFQWTAQSIKATTPGTCLMWANKGECTRRTCYYEHKWNKVDPETSAKVEKSTDSAFYGGQGFQ